MNGHRMSVNDIYQYLIQKNFNLSSQRVLKQPHLNQQTIWNILAFLSSSIKDNKYQQIQPFIFSILSPEMQKQSLKKIKEYIMISDALKKCNKNNEEYPIKQIFKPDRQTLIERITLLINANKFNQKINRDFDAARTQIKLKKQLVQELRRNHEATLVKIQEVKALKEREKADYQEKIVAIDNITKQWNYKKKERLDLLNSQQQLQNQLKKKTNMDNELGYANDDLNIRIKQLEREVIRNAPKLKKQRFAIIQQYEKLMKQAKDQFELWNTKISVLTQKIKPFYGIKQRSKTFKIEQRLKQIQNTTNQLNQLISIHTNDQSTKQGCINNKKQILKSIQNDEKKKKQLIQAISQEERQLALIEDNGKILRNQEKEHLENVKKLEDRNMMAQNQYKVLEEKIKYKSEKHKQRMVEMIMRFKSIEKESKKVIEDAFSNFQ